MTKKLTILAVLLATLVLSGLFWLRSPGTAPDGLAAPPTGGDFTLRSARGPLALHDLRGKVVLLYFGYTFCPDICPTSLALTARGLDLLQPEELARTQVLFVTVDPQRDTLEKLAQYTPFFHAAIVGLTGTPDEIAGVARQYGASYARHENGKDGNYTVDHSASTYVIDPAGKLVATLPHGAPAEDVARAIRAALPTH